MFYEQGSVSETIYESYKINGVDFQLPNPINLNMVDDI